MHRIESEQHGQTAGNPGSRQFRVLIVDDEIDIAFSLRVSLEQSGFIVDTFNEPEAALSNFKAGTYDIALIDIRMPQMNGFDLYGKLRKIDDKVKYCFMTAFEGYYDTLKKDHPTLNVECFMTKPIRLGNLLAVIKRQLEKLDKPS
jgi:DNA-binding response OmpR family regulator